MSSSFLFHLQVILFFFSPFPLFLLFQTFPNIWWVRNTTFLPTKLGFNKPIGCSRHRVLDRLITRSNFQSELTSHQERLRVKSLNGSQCLEGSEFRQNLATHFVFLKIIEFEWIYRDIIFTFFFSILFLLALLLSSVLFSFFSAVYYFHIFSLPFLTFFTNLTQLKSSTLKNVTQ